MELNNRKYGVLDYVKIPLKIMPITTILIIVLRICVASIPSLQVLATAYFVDTAIDIFKNGGEARIYFPLFLVMLLLALSWISSMLLSFVSLKLNLKTSEVITLAVARKRSRIAYEYLEDNDTWDLISRVGNEVGEKFNEAFDNILSLVEYVVRILSLMIVILTQVWLVAIVVTVVSIPSIFIAMKSGEEDYEAFEESDKDMRKAWYLNEILSSRDNIEERALFNFTEEVNEMWLDRYEAGRKIEEKCQKSIYIKMKIASIVTAIMSMSIAFVLLPSVKNNAITVGMYMGLVTATFNLVQQISWELTVVLQHFAKNKIYLKDFNAFSSLKEAQGADLIPDVRIQKMNFETIEFKNVSFAYPGTDRFILKDLSMILHKGKQYAFVGKNGAGKTTVTKLLTGLYKEYKGDILINGRNIKTFTGEELKAYFSIVYQDFAKYHISIKDNVILGDCGQTFSKVDGDELVNKTLEKMELKNEVDRMEKGIDTSLGKLEEGSLDLSGGQWQRVAIARCLFSNGQINILDEPTAALDPISESNIYKLFSKVSKGKTTILITHRLGAARIADEIVVIDDGTVVERGSHEELINKNGVYAEMFEAQRSWYDEGTS